MSENLRILIVEDNPADADFIHELLPQAGPLNFEVESVAHLAGAIARLARGNIDLVLLDLGLPDSQGLETLHTLQKAAANVPVVVMTGNDDQELAMAAVRDGAQDFLVKGQISGGTLIRTVRYALARQKAAEALRESENKHRVVIDTTGTGYVIVDAKGRVLDANDEYVRLTGHEKREQIFGRSVTEWTSAHDRSRNAAEVQKCVECGSVHGLEVDYVHSNGAVIPIEVNASTMGAGEDVRIVAICRDISKRRQTEDAVRQSREEFKSLFDNAPVGYHELDVEGRITRINKTELKMLGYSIEELIGEFVWKLSADEELTRRTVLAKLAGETPPSECFERTFRRKDGSTIPVLIIDRLMKREDGTIIGLHGAIQDLTERKRAVEEMKAILRTTMDGFYLVGQDGRFLDANDAYCRMTGYSREELLKMGIKNVEAIETDEDINKRMQQIRDAGNLRFETKHRRKDGTVITIEASVTVSRGGEEKFVVFVRDITEHKQAEDKLRESEELLNRSQQVARVGHYSFNVVSGDWKSSETLDDIFGINAWFKRDLAGWLQLIHPEDRDVMLAYLKEHVLKQLNLFDKEYRVNRATDGRIRWVHGIGQLRFSASGEVVEMFGVIQDITEVKRAGEKLTEAFNFNQSIIANASAGIVAYNASGQCVLANEAAARAVKGSVPWLLEQNFRQLESWRASGLLPMAEEVLATKESRRCEPHFTTTFGREVWLLCHLSHFVQNGEPHLLNVFTDATDQKKLEVQFLRSQRMESLGTLAGGIAHDLNNVLAPILISIQLLKEEIGDPALHELLDGLENNVKRGADLVRQVLVFGRGVKSDRSILNVQHIACEIKDIIRETFPKSVEFQLVVGRDLWPVSCDPTQIHQVLLNLCINARDAMPDGGNLSLRIENMTLEKAFAGSNAEARPGPYVLISLQDSGTGMTAEVQERMFEPFFTTKEHGKGTGLGLSTTLGIVKSHGGFILCDSAPGRGSVFKVFLPASAAPAAGTSSNVNRMPRGRNELILVVDDESAILELARATLKHFGYRVLTATNGAEAVEIYRKLHDKIAAVITDMAMPVMDGPAAITALKLINPDVKIIASSGFSASLTESAESRAIFKHFIQKPYTSAKLLQEIDAILHEDSTDDSAPEIDNGRPGGK